jgi:hypothetical protein
MNDLGREDIVRLIRKGRRAETRGKAVEGCITRLIISALTFLLRGFWLMLAVGIIHAEWWPALPTVGYWWSVLIVSLLPGVFSPVPPYKKAGAS